VCLRGELDKLEHLGDLLLDVLDATTLESEGDVFGDVEVREESIVLEHRVDRPLVRLVVRHVLVTKVDRARGRGLQPGDHTERRRLAAAGGAQQGEERSLRNLEVERLHSGERGELLGEL
jgi:hypothetical protein